MREVKSLASRQMRLQRRPYRHDGCIGKQTHHNGALLGCFLDTEQGFAGYPSIGNSFLKSLARTLSNDNVEAVVAQVASLTRTLYTISDYCNRFVFQNLTCLFQGKLFAGHHIFDNTAKIQLCHCCYCFYLWLSPG